MWLVMPENICCISGLLFHPLNLLQFLKNTYCLWIENKSQIECNRFFLPQVLRYSSQFKLIFWTICFLNILLLSLLRQNMDYKLVLQWIFLVAYCSHISITPVPDYLHRSMPLCCSCYVNERIRDRGSRADLQVSPSLGPAHTPLLGGGGSLYISGPSWIGSLKLQKNS